MRTTTPRRKKKQKRNNNKKWKTKYMKLLQRIGHDWATDQQQQLFLRHQKLRQRTVITGRRRANEASSIITLAYSLETVYSLRLAGGTQEEPRRLRELRRQTLSKRSRKLEFTGQSTEQDRASQRNNFRDKYLTDFWLVYEYEETIWIQEKNDERLLLSAVPFCTN